MLVLSVDNRTNLAFLFYTIATKLYLIDKTSICFTLKPLYSNTECTNMQSNYRQNLNILNMQRDTTLQSVPFHQGNGTGGTDGTCWGNYSKGRYAPERIQAGFLVPLVPLVPHIPWNGTEQNAWIKADSCSICSACPTHSVERNGTRPMVWADRYGRFAPVTRESGQSQFATLKLRSLALVPSSGAQSAPSNSTYGSSTVRLFLPR